MRTRHLKTFGAAHVFEDLPQPPHDAKHVTDLNPPGYAAAATRLHLHLALFQIHVHVHTAHILIPHNTAVRPRIYTRGEGFITAYTQILAREPWPPEHCPSLELWLFNKIETG